jgi:hypothetical protein
MLLRGPKGLRVRAQSHGQDRAIVRTEPWSGQSHGQGVGETGSHDPNQQTDEDQLHVRVASLRPREPLCQHHRKACINHIVCYTNMLIAAKLPPPGVQRSKYLQFCRVS